MVLCALWQQLIIITALAGLHPVHAHTYFTSDASRCDITGDPDIYGIGLRLGFYLQWLCYPIALVTHPADSGAIRTAGNIFSIAVMVNLFRTTGAENLALIEYWIVANLTVMLNIMTLPKSFLRKPKDAGGRTSRVVLAMLCLVCGVAQSTLVVRSELGLTHRECLLKISILWFMFDVAPVGTAGVCWRVFMTVWGVTCAVWSVRTIYFIFKEEEDNTHVVQRRETDETEFLLENCPRAALTITVGAYVIFQVEQTIAKNNIDLSAATVTSSGQLIPLLMGGMMLARVWWKAVVVIVPIKAFLRRFKRRSTILGTFWR
ncbi:hypothetical protein EDC01DRAFT_440904 [Geopyxis carbonaria]|nr:hypothetical protein EDC01DRAFT_440904 [Geopyxis carbonaria]